MAEKGQNLLELIAGRFRPTATAIKAAQAVVTSTVEPNRYRRSVEAMKAEQLRQHQEEAAKAARKTKWPVTSGSEDYDKLPDVARAREAAEKERIWQEYVKSNPHVVKRKDLAAVQKEIDASGGVSDFGESRLGKAVGGLFANTVGRGVDAIGKGIGYLTSAPKGTTWRDWSKQYSQVADQLRGDVAHDIANNFQLQADNARHGAESVGRFVLRYGDPRNYRKGLQDRIRVQSLDNARENAALAYADRQRRILGNFRDRDLAHPEKSTLGMLNYAGNAAVGEFAGGEAATAGIGGVAKGLGKGIQYGTKTIGAAGGRLATSAVRPLATQGRYLRSGFGQQARNLEAFRTDLLQHGQSLGANPAHPLMQQLSSPMAFRKTWAKTMGSADPHVRQIAAGRAGITLKPGSLPLEHRVGNAVQRGIDEMGQTVALPFNAAGHLATPITTAGRTVPAAARATGQSLKSIGGTGKDLLGLLRHPVRSTQQAAHYAAQHPFRAAGKAVAYPAKQVWGAVRPIAAPAGRAAFGQKGLQAGILYDAYGNARAGQYGAAAGDIGTMGAFGALGWKAIPALAAYYALSGNGEQE